MFRGSTIQAMAVSSRLLILGGLLSISASIRGEDVIHTILRRWAFHAYYSGGSGSTDGVFYEARSPVTLTTITGGPFLGLCSPTGGAIYRRRPDGVLVHVRLLKARSLQALPANNQTCLQELQKQVTARALPDELQIETVPSFELPFLSAYFRKLPKPDETRLQGLKRLVVEWMYKTRGSSPVRGRVVRVGKWTKEAGTAYLLDMTGNRATDVLIIDPNADSTDELVRGTVEPPELRVRVMRAVRDQAVLTLPGVM